MSSDEDSSALMAAFKKSADPKTVLQPRTSQPVSSPQPPSEDREDIEHGTAKVIRPSQARKALCVRVKPVENKEEYTYYEPRDEIVEIMREFPKNGELLYQVRLFGGITKQVSENIQTGALF
jgi:hypothetical protein